MGKMNRKALIEAAAKRSGLPREDVEKALAGLLDTVLAALAMERSVRLVGFGSFRVRKYAARQAVNPRTGKTALVPEQWIPVFRAGKKLRRSVRQANRPK